MASVVHQYMVLLSPGPLMIVRVPMTGAPGRRKLVVRWKLMLRALTPIMQAHELRAKDIFSLDPLNHPDEWDHPFILEDDKPRALKKRDERAKLESAFQGGSFFEKFWLYDWTDAGFVLARKPVSP